MSDHSKIECTDATWNPVTGCSRLTAGCDNCYAERFSERFRGVSGHPFENGFDLHLRPDRLDLPLRWKRSRLIFINSMSDLFHKLIPKEYIERIFDTMEMADWHHYQIITKRSSLMRNFINQRYANSSAPEHIWCGVSVENRSVLSRIRHLSQTRAATRFVCFEPLLESVGPVEIKDYSWVIVSGESGPRARPMQAEWVREIRDQCTAAGVPLFFKQWGGYRPRDHGNTLDGRQWLEYPRHFARVES